jgi:hypothetical protein
MIRKMCIKGRRSREGEKKGVSTGEIERGLEAKLPFRGQPSGIRRMAGVIYKIIYY